MATTEEYLAALETEKLGYERRGEKERAANVQKEIDKLTPKKAAPKTAKKED